MKGGRWSATTVAGVLLQAEEFVRRGVAAQAAVDRLLGQGGGMAKAAMAKASASGKGKEPDAVAPVVVPAAVAPTSAELQKVGLFTEAFYQAFRTRLLADPEFVWMVRSGTVPRAAPPATAPEVGRRPAPRVRR